MDCANTYIGVSDLFVVNKKDIQAKMQFNLQNAV